MRLCFYHAEPEWSGRARAFLDAAVALGERGHDVVFACARDGSAARAARERQVETVSWRSSAGRVRRAWRLRGVVRRHLADVVFVHSEREHLEAALAVRLADRGAVVKRIPPLTPLTRGREARLAGRLAPTGFIFALEHDWRGAAPPPRALEAVVVSAGVAPAPLAPAAEPQARRVVVVIGDVRRRSTLAALGGVALVTERHPDLRVTLVGPGANGDEARIQVAALRMGGSVQFVDSSASYLAAPRACASAELALVLAEHDDAMFGLLDCAAAGIPVVAEQSSLASAIIADAESGILTAGLDVEGYAALVAALLADRTRRSSLAQGAAVAAARWPLTAMADGFERSATAARDRSPWRV